MKFQCIKCQTPYEEPDVEAYLCPRCLSDRKRIAAEIDEKFKDRPKVHVMTDLEKYDMIKKQRGFVRFGDL